MTRGAAVAVGLVALVVVPSTSAAPARIVTWSEPGVSKSPYVDPSEAPERGYGQPPGEGERPNALRASVYLPSGYTPGSRTRYPVMYLLGGSGDSFDSWPHETRGRLLETLPDFPGFIVMPEADNGWYANWWTKTWGGPQWERYHLDQVVPYVHKRLPIRKGRRWHSVVGVSAGGLGAFYYASQRPGYFGSAVSFSGVLSLQRPSYSTPGSAVDTHSFAFGDQVAQEFYWRGHNPKELVENLRSTRLYATVGDGTGPADGLPTDPFGAYIETELAEHAKEFAAEAERVRAPLTFRPRHGIHAWRYWRTDLIEAVRWGLFARPPAPPRKWIYKTAVQHGRMWGLRFRFETRPAEVIRFERDGRKLTAAGTGRVRIRGRGCAIRATLPFDRRLPRGC